MAQTESGCSVQIPLKTCLSECLDTELFVFANQRAIVKASVMAIYDPRMKVLTDWLHFSTIPVITRARPVISCVTKHLLTPNGVRIRVESMSLCWSTHGYVEV